MLLLSSLVCLLPVILGLAVYHDLPEQMTMQYNIEGNPNWHAHKAVGAFGLPLIFFVLNIAVNIFVYADPKHENASKAMRVFVRWLIPFMSLFIVPVMLFKALGANIPIVMIIMVFSGAALIFVGNYMPKNRQNYTIGIRIPWTLSDSENWNKTHRMAGLLWIIGGIATVIMAFLPMASSVWLILFLVIITLLVMAPIIYSYLLYKRNFE
jgi:uncharacterized membrane protein